MLGVTTQKKDPFMPIYEFYCENCNTIYNFFSKKINIKKTPGCPKCPNQKLSRQMSSFAITGKTSDKNNMEELPFDETKMEKAMQILSQEAGNIDEDDPRKTADLMRKLSDISGMELGDGMNEALNRIEKGEDPEKIEAEMGDLLDKEEPFHQTKKRIINGNRKPKPLKDDTLYEL